ncbi:MAG: hypothetical protein FJ134_09410 [Deltaproteobacteria bacterium]|nr:hypothetical protein [Deltaproteobacteria bacterium]
MINHLTRMSRGFICVAGINTDTGEHIRPILRSGNLTEKFLVINGGPFDIGSIIKLERFFSRPDPPHTEDLLVPRLHITLTGVAPPEAFWKKLTEVSKFTLQEIFGEEMLHVGKSRYGAYPGKGRVSLGCLRLAKKPSIYIDTSFDKPRIRMSFSDGKLECDAPVTDLRLYHIDNFSPNYQLIEKMNEHVLKSSDLILSLGLSRPFSRSPEFDPVNWLQVNNIHFIEKPILRISDIKP